LRGEFAFPAEATVFCAVGTLGCGVNKRVDVCLRGLAEAIRRGGNVALVICGDGLQRAPLEKLAAELAIVDRVRFLGTRNDVPQVMASCDGFCHAAPFEPFGIVVIEAMATSLPVVVPNSGGIREAVDDGVNGFTYPALDHQALGAHLFRLQQEPELRAALGRSGRQTVQQRFSVRQYVQELYTLYGWAPSDSALTG
jgi:glycosyltransferase involved in cell wall biosynthesis